jgi:serine/threonine protein kinase
LGVAICSALNELHKKNQFHSDIRPQNIHWDSENSKVELAHPLEDGITSLFIDTRLPYMSPEHVSVIVMRLLEKNAKGRIVLGIIF